MEATLATVSERAGHAGPLRAGARRGRGDEADAARARAARRRAREGARAIAPRGRRTAGPAAGAAPAAPRPDPTAPTSSPARSRRPRSASAQAVQELALAKAERERLDEREQAIRKVERELAGLRAPAPGGEGAADRVCSEQAPAVPRPRARGRAAASDAAAATAGRAGSRARRRAKRQRSSMLADPQLRKAALDADVKAGLRAGIVGAARRAEGKGAFSRRAPSPCLRT